MLYNGFGQFLDIYHNSTNFLGYCDIAKPEEAVDGEDDLLLILTKMSEGKLVVQAVNWIFSARTGYNVSSLQTGAVGSVRSGGHGTATHGGRNSGRFQKRKEKALSQLPTFFLIKSL